MTASADPQPAPGWSRLAGRLAPAGVVLALTVLILASGWYRHLSLETLVRNRAALDALVREHTMVAVPGFVGVYVAAVAMSLPGAVLLTIAGGVLFGCWVGSVASVIGATIGASAIFLIASSAVGGALVRRAGPLAAKIADGFRADAFNYLLFLRLVPIFPFWLVNLAPALVGVPLFTFVAATAIGILPGTVAFTVLGAGLDGALAAQEDAFHACVNAGRSDCRLDFDLGAAVTPTLVGALAALGVISLLPVAVRYLRRFAGPRSEDAVPRDATDRERDDA